MSREINGEISVTPAGDVKIRGKYTTQFKAPLILQPCQHMVSQRESFLKREVWTIRVHGRADGFSTVRQHCQKLQRE
jgi:hypothetical protein